MFQSGHACVSCFNKEMVGNPWIHKRLDGELGAQLGSGAALATLKPFRRISALKV